MSSKLLLDTQASIHIIANAIDIDKGQNRPVSLSCGLEHLVFERAHMSVLQFGVTEDIRRFERAHMSVLQFGVTKDIRRYVRAMVDRYTDCP
jgi:hypothetical protein